MDIETPIGPIRAAPASTGRDDLVLWAIYILVIALGVVCLLLWQKVKKNEQDCREDGEQARKEAAQIRAQNEELYRAAIEATATRETRLVEVVERNTAAFHALKEHVGSGYYRSIQQARESGSNSPERRRPPGSH